MADTTHEAHVRGTPPPEADADIDDHGLAVLKVTEADMPDAEPFHTVAEKLGTFDPNAALRGKMGTGPGLQDSEALRPAVWRDVDDAKAAVIAADADVKKAEQALAKAKAAAKDARKGA